MAQLFTDTITSILGGQSPMVYFGTDDQFLSSIAVDPDHTVDQAGTFQKAGGVITPIGYSQFSSTAVNTQPVCFITTHKKEQLMYSVLSDGSFLSHTYNESTGWGSETDINTHNDNLAGGGAYYNNYIYIFGSTDVSRYGPLDGTPAFADDFWVTTLSKTALVNVSSDYPSINNIRYPYRPSYVHSNNTLYFADYLNGKGILHAIKTTKTTAEGDTDSGSAYNVLDLPAGYHITAISSWGTDLAILAVQLEESSGITVRGGTSALFLWDTVSDSFYRKVDIRDPMASALLNTNGQLYVWHGNLGLGHTISRYLGGFQLERINTINDAAPPTSYAVDSLGGRITWGCTINYPEKAGVALSIGYQSGRINPTALNCVARVSGDLGTVMGVGCLKYVVREEQGIKSQLVIGWRDTDGSATYGYDAYGTGATTDSIFRSFVFSKPRKFQINKIRIPLAKAIAANMSITPKIYVDNASTTYDSNNGLAVINSTNYTNSEQVIIQYPDGVVGENNYFLELTQAHTVAQSVLLPIVIEGELFDE